MASDGLTMNFMPLFVLVTILIVKADTKPNVQINIPSSIYLRDTRIGYQSIDGATLVSMRSYNSYDKQIVRLRGLASDTRLKIKLERWSVPLGASLLIRPYFSGTRYIITSSTPPGHTIEDLSRDVVLEFHSPTQRYSGFYFKIVVTSMKKLNYCYDFKCNNNDCISTDLRCDGTDHCFDNSDELPGRGCAAPPASASKAVNIGAIIGIVVGAIVLFIIMTVCVTCCCLGFCRSGTNHGVVRRPAGGIAVVTTSTHVPPPGSYPTQPVGYPMQPGVQQAYPNPYSPPPFPAATSPPYTYAQGTEGAKPDPGAPPAYDSVVGSQNNIGYSVKST